MRRPPDARRGGLPPREPPPPQDPSAAKQKVGGIVTDSRVSMEAWRAARQLHRRGVDLARYYAGRPLLSIGLGELLELERAGRWAA